LHARGRQGATRAAQPHAAAAAADLCAGPQDHQEKKFLWLHSRTCFELLDEDGSKTVSLDEFYTISIVFNISRQAAEASASLGPHTCGPHRSPGRSTRRKCLRSLT
jgi:hypothetical protein